MKFFRLLCVNLLFVVWAGLLVGCAVLHPIVEEPTVNVVGVQLLPSRGLQQRIAVELMVANPNAQDLSLNGISYTIAIEKFSVLNGVSNQVPVLKAYQETPVTLEVSANLLEIARLFEYFSRKGVGHEVDYLFTAKLDFSRWLPVTRVEKAGKIPLIK